MKTTLNAIRDRLLYSGGWQKLLSYLGKTKADDEPVSITTILDSNGLDDALWCLRAVTGHDREIRLYAVWCARQVQHLMTDQRSIDALDVAERYARGEATEEELAAASDAASDASSDAAWDAADAADDADAAWASARAADAAADVTDADAKDAARAAKDAARAAKDADAAAWAAALAAQEAELRRVCEAIAKVTGEHT